MAKEYTPYWEKLRDPRWQKKRLEIMERDDFTCVHCQDNASTLNVHHGFYTKDTEPWDYPDESLRTLCEDCHKKYKEKSDFIKRLLGYFDLFDIHIILGFMLRRLSFKIPFSNALVGFEEDLLKQIVFGLSSCPNNESNINELEEFIASIGNSKIRLGKIATKIFSLEKTNGK